MAASFFDQAISLCRRAGFRSILLRAYGFHPDHAPRPLGRCGDIRFLFGIDARPNLVALAEQLPESAFSVLELPKAPIETTPRQRPERHKQRIVEERGFETLHTLEEAVAEFSYQPVACKRAYRVIVLRKLLATDKGQMRLFEKYRYFFFITNDCEMTAAEVVHSANGRCNQENLMRSSRGAYTLSPRRLTI